MSPENTFIANDARVCIMFTTRSISSSFQDCCEYPIKVVYRWMCIVIDWKYSISCSKCEVGFLLAVVQYTYNLLYAQYGNRVKLIVLAGSICVYTLDVLQTMVCLLMSCFRYFSYFHLEIDESG